MQMTGSRIIIECLKEQGVDTIFGYPGGTILNIYDELYRHDDLTHILTSHEQGASHAADGYARSTGKVGVCFATSGPGATNLVTGIATAYMDSTPLVAITANVAVPLLGKDSFQEIDIAGVVMPITKHSVLVKDVTKLAETIRRAFVIAQSGRPGPVLVDVAKDVTAELAEYIAEKPKKIKPSTKNIKDEDIEEALCLIKNAKRPYVYYGGGVILSNASKELTEFIHKIDAPVANSLMGKSAFDETDELYTGMVGMHGTKTSNLGIGQCDLLVVIGARFSDRVTGNSPKFAEDANILQIDIDPAEINKNIVVDASVIGDVKEVLKRLNKQIKPVKHVSWINNIKKMKKKYPLSYNKEALTGPGVIETLYKVTKGNAIVTTEVGQHQMWAAQYFKNTKPRTFITSGGLGTMGYGLGAAIGAKFGNPNKLVVNIAGDGCFRMNMNEIATAARNDLPIVQLVINNQVLGMVRQWQTLFYEERYSHTILKDKVDFVKLAESMGAVGLRVTKISELEDTLKKAISCGKTVVVDCMIDCDDKVFPMVPAGRPIEEVFDEDDLIDTKVKK